MAINVNNKQPSSIGYFCLVGPLVGFGIIFLMLLGNIIIENDFNFKQLVHISFSILLLGSICAYLIGLLPAALTGHFADYGRNPKEQIVLAVIAGSLICVFFSMLIEIDLSFNLVCLIFGGFSGLFTMLLRHENLKKRTR